MNEWEWNLLEDKATVDHMQIGGVTVRPGDHVRLQPKEGGDILDLALRGQIAMVESIEEDYEGSQHICVVLDDDPGRDLGLMRQPGHRFFFTPAEIEPTELVEQRGRLKTPLVKTPTILVAGIGNIFLGDDGFGVEVVRRLLTRPQPAAVRIADFGIRGLDLAYALQDGYDATILIDAYPHGQPPGTISVIEPDLKDLSDAPGGFVQPHSMNPMNVLLMATSMSGSLKQVLLVGCEPLDFGGDEGKMGLSGVVSAAIDAAVEQVERLLNRILNGQRI